MSVFAKKTKTGKGLHTIPTWPRLYLTRFHRDEQGSEAIINVVLLAMGAMVCLFLWNDIWTSKIRKWVADTTTSILAD